MTDTPELNVWLEAKGAWSAEIDPCEYDNAAAAVIRSYGDQRYQAAIADVVGWLEGGDAFALTDHEAANEITRRFGKEV